MPHCVSKQMPKHMPKRSKLRLWPTVGIGVLTVLAIALSRKSRHRRRHGRARTGLDLVRRTVSGGEKQPGRRRGSKPQLTRNVDEAPEGKGWLHEIHHDGYPIHAQLDD